MILHPTSTLFMNLSVFHRATQIKGWLQRKRGEREREMCYGLYLKEGIGILFNKIKHSPGTLMMIDGYMHYLLTVGKRTIKYKNLACEENYGGYKVGFNKRKKKIFVFVLFVFFVYLYIQKYENVNIYTLHKYKLSMH